MRTICSAAVDRIAIDAQSQRDDALAQYGTTMDAILKSLKAKGDIDTYVVIEQEAKRFQKEMTVPATAPHPYVANAVALYQKQVQSINMDADRRTATLYRQYVAALGKLVKDLMVQENIEDAKVAGQAKRDAESALAAIEMRMPKATVPESSPSSTAKSKDTETSEKAMPPSLIKDRIMGKDNRNTIPPDAEAFKEHHYMVVMERLPWDESKSACKCQRAVKTSHGWALENQPL
jgi:hypothetical protein